MEWDWIGLDELGLIGIFCAWSRKDGVEFGLKVSSDGWDGAGDIGSHLFVLDRGMVV